MSNLRHHFGAYWQRASVHDEGKVEQQLFWRWLAKMLLTYLSIVRVEPHEAQQAGGLGAGVALGAGQGARNLRELDCENTLYLLLAKVLRIRYLKTSY